MNFVGYVCLIGNLHMEKRQEDFIIVIYMKTLEKIINNLKHKKTLLLKVKINYNDINFIMKDITIIKSQLIFAKNNMQIFLLWFKNLMR
jgi:hypothetical protein